jgi:hypothetical protein
MDRSIFMDKSRMPDERMLAVSLGDSHRLWTSVFEYVRLKVPGITGEWNYPGDKYGWSLRLKDKNRVILYMLPRDRFFKIAFVFGQKAYESVMDSNIPDAIKDELSGARVYAEGRGIRLEVKDPGILPDIRQLIDFKLQ